MPNYTNKNYTMQLGLKCSEESAYSSIETAYKCQNIWPLQTLKGWLE